MDTPQMDRRDWEAKHVGVVDTGIPRVYGNKVYGPTDDGPKGLGKRST